MRTVVSSPSTGIFAQQVGCAFLECGALDAYVTPFAYREDGILAHSLNCLPRALGQKLRKELQRRSVRLVPSGLIKTWPFWEVIRMLAVRGGATPVLEDRIWDRLSHTFDAFVARRFVSKTAAVYAYEYCAKTTFERARERGVAAILALSSLSNRSVQALQQAEKVRFPELKGQFDAYFDGKFEPRQRRRDDEIRLADVIVTNSNLTKQSYIDAGADAAKVIAVPLASPTALSTVSAANDPNRPLKIVWAGNFTIGKGAHYFLEAWRKLDTKCAANASVYGLVALPERAVRPLPDGIVFHGSVPQSELFAAFEAADVLVFPTLSDGFGLVVSEAFARGLPVIATDRAGAAQFIRQGENGFIIPSADAAALRDRLQWCLDNRQKLYAMRFAALETAKSWQWSDYRRTLIASLDVALAGRGYSPSFSYSAL